MKKHLLMLELNRGPSGIEYLKAAKKLGIFVTLVSFKPTHYLKMEKQLGSSILEYVDNILVIDTHHNINKLIDTIIEYNNIYKIDGVIGTYDLEMLQASLLAKNLGLIGTNPLAVEISRNKFLTRKALYESNIKVPKFALVNGLEEAIEFGNKIGYPCILKPVDGQGSDNVVLITSPEGFKEPIEFHRNNPIYYRGVKKYPKLLVEEYLEGPLVSVETISYQNEVYVLGITDRTVGKPPYFVAETASFPAKIDNEHEVIQMVIDALQAINFDFGPAHTEVIITEDGPRIVEINPRLAGGSISLMMNWSFGRSIHEEIIKMYMGMPFSFESKRRGIGAYLRIFSDKTGILKNIEGIDLAYQVPGIKNIYLEHELGDLVSHNPKGLADGLGVISAFGEDKEEIMKHLYEARSKLNIIVSSSR
ncbi:hypothetical protein GS3922_05430 [Geobacillus subterraneus]|jgi:S-sulfo-L-cysteine synthase (3-phospho-L-serine-dependent)|uniref:ATP-grasp domain-containing protein n=2 Tax=Geobacillus TaxID=129337 RepID=A0ABN4NF06_9BACL|nr:MULTISPECIES: ATP-grasp domain-containing protein [Geobacillus]AMX83168.1 hypothetical protein GS3922_05430 [Geobacillus subterraneus]KZS26432.1 hypothetical protein A5418_01095 [Geobacillus subterraneus]OXB90291.1 hypothetical protein B9L21_05885 [Geobacillus uzenensis]QIZ66984.1 ATP-grasp domain-containing protein [Geobacillus subterraneus]